MKPYFDFLKMASACIVSCTVFSAFADLPLMPAKVLPAYQTECASCHTAYPPALLSKPAWQKIMSGLDKHYGTDASLDGPTQRQIGLWLQAQGGTYKRVETSSPEERITTTQWFEKKHRTIDKNAWLRKSIKGRSQCQACHASADIGDFEDDRVRIPF